MSEIGAYEAKTRLSELLEDVRKGARYVITRHGQPIAELRPVGWGASAERLAALERIAEYQQAHDSGPISTRELVEEGRRI